MLVSWNITRECNLRCKHCYRDAGVRAEDELTTIEGVSLLEDIARAGFKIIVFSGGEPLLREDIYELVAKAREVGLKAVFGSNGTLITSRVAKRLKKSGAVRIGISIDSINPAIHDDFRQVQGSYLLALRGIKNCKEADLDFQIHTTVMEFNYEEVEDITDLSVKLGAKAHHIFFLVPTGRALETSRLKTQDSKLLAKRYEKLLHRILAKQGEVDIELKPTCAPQFMRIAKEMGISLRFAKGCLAGISYCSVLPNGDLHPCPYLPLKVGNVRERNFHLLWQDSEVFKKLRNMDYNGKCGQCKYKDICGGCRARAYYYSDGDYMAGEPWCFYTKANSEEGA